MAVPSVSCVAGNLGWPEGPTILPDGSVALVETYRGQITAVSPGGEARALARFDGAPNSCVAGSDGWLYVCQNGGTCGPWRAPVQVRPSVQRVRPGGAVETIAVGSGEFAFNGPNDLVFGPDGTLYVTDPGTYRPQAPDDSRIFAIAPDGTCRIAAEFARPTFPNGIAVQDDGAILWCESYTGHVWRQHPDGRREDLGRLPGPNPVPDGMTIAEGGWLVVTDIVAGGLHVLHPDGRPEDFVPVAAHPTNCVFDGPVLWVTAAGTLADTVEPVFAGGLYRVEIGLCGIAPRRGAVTLPGASPHPPAP